MISSKISSSHSKKSANPLSNLYHQQVWGLRIPNLSIYFMNQGISTLTLHQPFVTESGFRFDQTEVAYKTWGTLSDTADNVVVIFHALTGHAAADEWFHGLFTRESFLNADRQFIICINTLGSCYGTTGPKSLDPASGKPWRGRFPNITIRDIVKHQQQVLDHFGINQVELVIGASMGGMQALEFCLMDDRAKSAVLIGMGKAHSPWAIGISHAQRAAIRSDANWNGGNYTSDTPPAQGLAAARMMAMITYRAHGEYRDRFARKLQDDTDQFQVESYLNYQGEKLVKRFDAWTYIRLTEAMDRHDVSRGRGDFAEVLSCISIPIQVVGISTDALYPTVEQQELAQLIPTATYQEIDSPHGHDAFLIEFEKLNAILTRFTTDKEQTTA